MLNDPQAWSSRLKRCDPADIGAIYDRFAPALYGAALRMCGSPEEAGTLLERTFVRLGQGAFCYEPACGRPVLWLLARLRESMGRSIQHEGSTVDGAAMQQERSARCFGLHTLAVENTAEGGGEGLAGIERKRRHLALRKALGRG